VLNEIAQARDDCVLLGIALYGRAWASAPEGGSATPAIAPEAATVPDQSMRANKHFLNIG
jgi:hypothetical protein